MRSIVFCILISFVIPFVISCDARRNVDTSAVKKELQQREVKKITDAEIMARAMEIGEKITDQAQKSLAVKLQASLKRGGTKEAISYCNLHAMPIVDSISQKYGAQIKRVSIKARNKHDLPDSLERQILEAYKFQLEDSASLQSNIQPLADQYFLFTKPIMINSGLCLNCHGRLDNGMLESTRDLLKTKYPDDQAVNYQIGDLRGMWSVRIPKKNIVLSF